MPKIKLKSCPFCGGEARMLVQPTGYSIDCIICGAKVMAHTKYKTQAATGWNMRVVDTEALRIKLEKILNTEQI